MQTIWQQLHLYLDDHTSIFRDESAAAGFGSAVGKYHGLLRQQLTRPLERFYTDAFTAQFVAEANTGKGLKVQDWMKPFFRFVVPAAIIIIYIAGLMSFPWK